MKKIFSILVVLATVAWSNVSYGETLRVGVECTYYPFSFRDSSGELQGYDVDVAKGIAKRLNMEPKFVCQKWDGLLPSLMSKKFDVIIASMSITEERLKRIDFSIPYRVSIGQFVAEKERNLELFKDDGTLNPEGFDSIRIGLQRSSTYERWIKAHVPDADIVLYDSVDGVFLDLKNGRIDAAMTNPMKAYVSFLSKKEGSKFTVVGPQIDEKAYFGPGAGVGIRKGNEVLKNKINKALQAEIESGALEEYAHKYFPFAIHPQQTENNVQSLDVKNI